MLVALMALVAPAAEVRGVRVVAEEPAHVEPCPDWSLLLADSTRPPRAVCLGDGILGQGPPG